jgi:hypothetical protein
LICGFETRGFRNEQRKVNLEVFSQGAEKNKPPFDQGGFFYKNINSGIKKTIKVLV